MYTLTDSAPSNMTLLDFPAPAGRVIAGAFDDALETNPVPLFMLAKELHGLRSVGPRLTREEAQEQAKRSGVSVSVPEDGISTAALGILIERRKDQAARDLLFARREGTAATVGMFTAGLAGAVMDPVNAAAGFIPALSGTRYAATLAQAGTAGSRAGLRLAVGAAEGAIGATAVEMPTIALRRDLQDEYGLYDSLANITFGTFANAGLRGISGAVRDHWRGIQAARQEDFLRSIEPAEWQAARLAYERQLERSMFSELDMGFSRGEGPSEGLIARWSDERIQAQRLAATDDAIGRMQARMSDAEIERFVEAERKMRAEAAAPDERMLLDAAGVAERKFRDMDLREVRERLARGEGLIVVPGSVRETLAAVSDETHAHALKTAVGQAVEGRRIEVDSVLRSDPVFGPQRLNAEEVKSRARTNMAPESRIAADQAASRRADEVIETEAPTAKPGRAEPPPPRGSSGAAVGAEAKSKALTEVEAKLSEAKKQLKQAANDAGVELPKPKDGEKDASARAQDYQRAWQAIAACARGKGL